METKDDEVETGGFVHYLAEDESRRKPDLLCSMQDISY